MSQADWSPACRHPSGFCFGYECSTNNCRFTPVENATRKKAMTEKSDTTLEYTPSPEDALHALIGKLCRADRQQLLQVAQTLKDIPSLQYFDVPQTCRILNVSRATLYRRIQDGRIKPLNLYIRRCIFEAAEVGRYLRKQTQYQGEVL